MSRQAFPLFMDQPGAKLFTFAIDGSAVGASAGTAGLDNRGLFLCTISKLLNVVTINWNVSFGDVPYIFFQPNTGQLDTLVEITTKTASQLVFQTVLATDNSAVNDADLQVFVVGYNTTSFVS
ncbi:MAG TPA: hypothetical protein VFO37_04825 [Chitinophagaceae bacterium]|nr:hypothetical protein [Chitinophagaceae bacterium]